ncbi:MAG: flagellar biosynthesis anti-sigma factor FlgM [Fusobacteriota bacterium]
MKIPGLTSIYQSQKTNKVTNKKVNKDLEKNNSVKNLQDKVTISDKAKNQEVKKEVEIAKKYYDSLPEVREDRVSELKSKIQSGNYNVSDEDVANAILGRLG